MGPDPIIIYVLRDIVAINLIEHMEAPVIGVGNRQIRCFDGGANHAVLCAAGPDSDGLAPCPGYSSLECCDGGNGSARLLEEDIARCEGKG